MTISLTKNQRACLDAIASYRAANGVMPSIDDLRVALALTSKSSVFRLLKGLEKRRAIHRSPAIARGISILTDKCPHCGEPLQRVKNTGKSP
jgi:repressor LexA